MSTNYLRKTRTRNNAAIIPRTKSNLLNHSIENAVSQQHTTGGGGKYRLKQSFTQISTPKLTEPTHNINEMQ